jgi:hypothetical protein
MLEASQKLLKAYPEYGSIKTKITIQEKQIKYNNIITR